MAIRRGFATVFTWNTVAMVIIAAIAFAVARLLHQHLIGRIDALARVPEISDIIVMILAGAFMGRYTIPGVIGAGLSLIHNLAKRLNVRDVI